VTLPGIPIKDGLARAASPLDANLSLEDHDEMVQRLTLPAHNLSGLEEPLLKMFHEPVELLLGQVREDLDLAQIVDQTAARCTRKLLRQVTPH
jgi:hypothetical protein